MKRFVIKIVLFFSCLATYFAICWIFNINTLERNVDLSSHYLICGDSYPRRALDPDVFNEGINVSQSAESIYITFLKLQRILEYSIVDTLIFGFGHHNITSYNDRKLIDTQWSGEMFNRLYAILDDRISVGVPFDKSEFRKVRWRNMALYPKMTHLDYIGGFKTGNGSQIDDVEEEVLRHYSFNQGDLISQLSLNYLDSIHVLCEQNAIELVLVCTPVHMKYYNSIPKEVIIEFERVLDSYRSKGVRIFDYSKTDMQDDMFYNSDHLNSIGANEFSSKLALDFQHLQELE